MWDGCRTSNASHSGWHCILIAPSNRAIADYPTIGKKALLALFPVHTDGFQKLAEKASQIEINAAVLRPLDLLAALGISEPDPVPIRHDQFYNLYEPRSLGDPIGARKGVEGRD